MVICSKYNITISEYNQMDSLEFAYVVRGKELAKLEDYKYLRLLTAIIIQPHVKKAIAPQKLINLGDETESKKTNVPSKEERERVRQIHEMWDKSTTVNLDNGN